MDIAIKRIKELLLKELRISGFETRGTIAKQILTGLETEIKLKNYHIEWKRILFSYEALDLPRKQF